MRLRYDCTEHIQAFTDVAATLTLSGGARWLRLVATQDCHYSVKDTATTSSPKLPADMIDMIPVDNPASVSVIRSSSNGNLHVTEFYLSPF